jgi:ABC-2 type transport system permease protein
MRKEVLQTVRDRRMLALLLVAPTVQLLVFGYVVDLEVDQVPTTVVDADRTRTSREHVRELLADGTLALEGWQADLRTAERRLIDGDTAVVVVVPDGFTRALGRGEPAEVQALVDGSDPNRSTVAVDAFNRFFRARSAERLARAGRGGGGGVDGGIDVDGPALEGPIEVVPRVLYNPGLETAWYMVPGIAGLLLMIVTTVVMAMGLARERERGTLEQVMVTPIPSWVYLAGKLIPFAAIGLFDFLLAVVVGAWLFGVPVVGSLAGVFGVTVLYIVSLLGIGLSISTVSSTQQQAFMGGFLFVVPAVLLSGVLTPVRGMPDWMRAIAWVNPLRHFQELVRASLLRGAEPWTLWPSLLTLTLLAALTTGLAVRAFRKTAS